MQAFYCGQSSPLHCSKTELADFQSSIVLENSLGEAAKGEDDNEAELVDKFLQQYSWMRRLSDALSCLYESGHFDYYPKFQLTDLGTNFSKKWIC